MISSLSALVAAAEEQTNTLPAPPLAIGAGVLAVFVILLVITMSFNKYR